MSPPATFNFDPALCKIRRSPETSLPSLPTAFSSDVPPASSQVLRPRAELLEQAKQCHRHILQKYLRSILGTRQAKPPEEILTPVDPGLIEPSWLWGKVERTGEVRW